MRISKTLVFIIGFSAAFTNHPVSEVTFNFLHQEVTLPYESGFDDLFEPISWSPEAIELMAEQIEQLAEKDIFTESLLNKSKALQLSGWPLYLFFKGASDKILSNYSRATKDLFIGYLLSASGYELALASENDEIFLIIRTQSDVYGKLIQEINGKQYFCLNQNPENWDKVVAPFINNGTQPFNLSLDYTNPELTRPISKEVSFQFLDSTYRFGIITNGNLPSLLDEHPLIQPETYFKTTLSTMLINSLIPQLEDAMAMMQIEEKVAFLMAFTRSAFKYKTDQEGYGRNRPMIAEEVFINPYSDCEDRAALFYQLNTLLLDLPLVVLDYPNHISIGIAAHTLKVEKNTPTININDQAYYYCDPTGPEGYYKIGHIPPALKAENPKPFLIFQPQAN
ncbi:MAG: hypothetical protein RLZZ248_1311 [Bacteroidota bacterium]|jgi:hypothetical protein